MLLLLTGVVGSWGYWHGLRTVEDSFYEECRKTKACFRFCSRMFRFTGSAFYVVYPFMILIFLIQLVMLLRGKTVYSRRMLLFTPVLRVAVCALVPDIRQALGCELHTFDYVMTQCSGNYAPCLYFLACLILPDSFTYAKQK